METKIRKIGNSLGVTLPKQLIDELHLKQGDKITITKSGSNIELEPVDPEFEEWAEAYRESNKDYKEVFKELAK
ncbi:AbrB/MazE/SpoVT family DNA-binding domain-containing protein [Gracilimonas sp.]|uniref:AbrB/MazE/SpoVT family DNA-binding domain-containing protein n=1 Tax=Gracilimonas sp. TaxID=1974203 RepID=UPI0028724ADC|nr:AbrB/MazE/SpoVT family DNA-binding domain-containing protein [Gracilimonas sp.]